MRAEAAAGWSRVRGQPAAVEILRSAVVRDQVAHAWMFVGPEDVGQAEAARALAAALNCPDAADGVGCGACRTCRRIAEDPPTFPGFTELRPEGQFHLVDAVREVWVPAATRTTVEGRTKILRVVAADRMNEPTQNAFLKILEEPPRDDAGRSTVVWLLDVQDESPLLDTIVSRCRRLTFTPWTPDVMLDEAHDLGLEGDRARALSRAAMGSPQRLRELAGADVEAVIARRRAERDERGRKKPTDEELEDLRRQVSAEAARGRHLALLGDLLEQGPGHVVPLAKAVDDWASARREVQKGLNEAELERHAEAFQGQGSRVEWPAGFKQRLEKRHRRLEREARDRAVAVALDDVASYLRDLMAVRAGADEHAIVHVDHLDRLRREAAAVAPAVVLDTLAAIGEAREALERNAQPQLQLERLFMRLAVQLYEIETNPHRAA